jgi:hypothetical protein
MEIMAAHSEAIGWEIYAVEDKDLVEIMQSVKFFSITPDFNANGLSVNDLTKSPQSNLQSSQQIRF